MNRPDLSGLGWVAAAAVRSFGKQCLSCRPCSSTSRGNPKRGVWPAKQFPVEYVTILLINTTVHMTILVIKKTEYVTILLIKTTEYVFTYAITHQRRERRAGEKKQRQCRVTRALSALVMCCR